MKNKLEKIEQAYEKINAKLFEYFKNNNIFEEDQTEIHLIFLKLKNEIVNILNSKGDNCE